MSDNSSPTTNTWLDRATKTLKDADIATARLDCLVLLEDVLSKNRAHVLAHPEMTLTLEQITVLDEQILQRAEHTPLAYIRGKTEFYGREFIINKHVLEPRPETETMIELLKKLTPSIIIDIGTGSGAIAITAKKLFPSKQVIAIDIDARCLEVARKNTHKHNATISLLQADLLENSALIEGMVILANLPYVPDDFKINRAALHEPKVAIFGGKDGLDLYRKMFAQIKSNQKKPTHILTESLPFQHKSLEEIAQNHGYKLQETNDFIQIFTPKN